MERFLYYVEQAMDFIAHAAHAIDDNTDEYLIETKGWYADTYSPCVAVARYILEEFSKDE